MKESNLDQYAVFGNPISHSLSPKIHQLFAKQFDHLISYKAIKVELDKFYETTNDFFNQGGLGLSITVPFKEQAFEYADSLSDRAKKAGAVNTLSYDGKICLGDNTDGVGLVNDLTNNHQIILADKNILVLGAGGAVRGILGPVLEQLPQSLTICNRTLSKAEDLIELFSDSIPVNAVSYDDLTNIAFDVVINGTSASLQNQLPPLPNELFSEDACSYDMMYSNQQTLFQQWSLEHGASNAFDGLGMLVEQAAEAYYLWRGVRPETKPVIEKLR